MKNLKSEVAQICFANLHYILMDVVTVEFWDGVWNDAFDIVWERVYSIRNVVGSEIDIVSKIGR